MHYQNRLKKLLFVFLQVYFVYTFFLFDIYVFAAPAALTYQGRILKTDGTPLEYNNVSFVFQITDPTGSCVIYQEQVNGYNMVNSKGVFDVPIGEGSVQFPLGGGKSILDMFGGGSNYSCGSCTISNGSYTCANGTSTYAAGVSDNRRLRVSFYDGIGWRTVTPDNIIRSVPFAGNALTAQKLGDKTASDFLTLAGLPNCSVGTFLTWNGTSLTCASSAVATVSGDVTGNLSSTVVSKIKGYALDFTVAPAMNQVLTWNGASWVAANLPASGGGGTVTNVAGTAPISVATGTSTPVISLANGTAAGQVYRWDGTSSWVAAKLNYKDLFNNTASSPWPSGTCAAGEAVVFNSASDNFSCVSLTIATSQLTGTLNASLLPAFTGDVTSTAGSTTLTLANSGVPAGTYKSVTVDAKGRVTGATNPTTLSGYGITDAIHNLGGVRNISADLDASKPAAPVSGDLFVATDTQKIYRYNGASWSLIASAGGSGGTVTGVSSANADISVATGSTTPVLTLNSGSAGGAGDENKIAKLDNNGQLPSAMIPNLDAAKITTGSLALANGGTGASTQAGAANAILPSQTGNSGKVLQTDGTNVSWVTPGASCDNIATFFPFTYNSSLTTNTLITSNIALVTGLDPGCTVTVGVGGQGAPEYRICSNASCATVLQNWTTGNTTQDMNGKYIQLRATTSSNVNTTITVTANVGAVPSDWGLKTISDCSAGAIGTVCDDGTIYAGTTLDGVVPLYTTRCDAGQTWNGSACINSRTTLPYNSGSNGYVDTALVNCNSSNTCDVSGETNTVTLAATDSDTAAGTQLHSAATYCDNLNQNGQTDWYLPSISELMVLITNQAAIGNLSAALSSSEKDLTYIWYYDGYWGSPQAATKNTVFNFRCVRK